MTSPTAFVPWANSTREKCDGYLEELLDVYNDPEGSTNPTEISSAVVSFVISTVFLYHMTFTVNSLAHVWGKRRFLTNDDSRNNPVIALFTLGEGWHNNHHAFPSSARHGLQWWQVDPSYLALLAPALDRDQRIHWYCFPVDLPAKLLGQVMDAEAGRRSIVKVIDPAPAQIPAEAWDWL